MNYWRDIDMDYRRNCSVRSEFSSYELSTATRRPFAAAPTAALFASATVT
jgi:hypothetical protein